MSENIKEKMNKMADQSFQFAAGAGEIIAAKDLEIERLKTLAHSVLNEFSFSAQSPRTKKEIFSMVDNWRSQLTTPKER